MVQVDLKKLFDKLSPVCSKTLELGVALCVTRTNYNVELEHWLFCLADRADSDFVRLLESFQIDVSRVKTDLTKSLDRLRTGNAKSPGLSPEIVDLATEAWTL
ncbi:MAG: type VI secretion system ATPase TssH, partial [Planctomycetaceae bacterium]|nr:type VI secretion system ATPase TssH [Planctomycetaceae bacterium]